VTTGVLGLSRVDIDHAGAGFDPAYSTTNRVGDQQIARSVNRQAGWRGQRGRRGSASITRVSGGASTRNHRDVSIRELAYNVVSRVRDKEISSLVQRQAGRSSEARAQCTDAGCVESRIASSGDS